MPELSSAILPGVLAFAVACIAALILVMTKHLHGRLSMDTSEGVQKFHDAPTPRIGGVSVMLGLLAALPFLPEGPFGILVMTLACGSLAFISGFVEDITKKVSPRQRLIATLISGLAFAVASGVTSKFMNPLIPDGAPMVIESILLAGGFLLIVIGLAGSANAVNIIDGFHGLSAGSLIIMSLTIAGLAYGEGDHDLAIISLVFASAVAGFMAINFPRGLIFFGDAGAYFCGYAIGVLTLLLAARTDISAFVSILILAYPVYETLFSIVRKARRDGHSPTQPDGVHMHMLVSRSLSKPLADMVGKPRWTNALTGALMWPFSLVCSVLSIAAMGTHTGGILGILVFALFYGRMYQILSLQKPAALNVLERRIAKDQK